MSERFGADWLALREPFDAAARSRALATRLIACLPAHPHLLDLGAGTGSLLRWLAPMIGRSQAWTLLDADSALLDLGFARIAEWAGQQGWHVTFPGRGMSVYAPGFTVCAETMKGDLAATTLPRADAILCSALLDLVSLRWLETLAAQLAVPFLACLSIDGRQSWQPLHWADARVRTALHCDLHRDKGFGPALGPSAPATALRLLDARGFHVASAQADWRIPSTSTPMLGALISGTADAAAGAGPQHAPAVEAWRRARRECAAAGRLAIQIGHRDILAIPRTE